MPDDETVAGFGSAPARNDQLEKTSYSLLCGYLHNRDYDPWEIM
ncbi:hypothetical protein [Sphingomonas sp.]|nr:hypothetical protein [Sphingomonas sp.]